MSPLRSSGLTISFFKSSLNNIVSSKCNFLNINSKLVSEYNPEFSKNNIGKFKEILDKKEISILIDNLSEWIYIDN